MDFPLTDLMDEDACYRKLVKLLHPHGLACPRCQRTEGLRVHRCHRAPVLVYRCAQCGRVFNAFTETVLDGVRRRPSAILLVLRGIAQGVSTAQLARELGCSRPRLLEWRHRLQCLGRQALDQTALQDWYTEADEMDQNAGEKRHAARRSARSATPAREQSARARHVGQ